MEKTSWESLARSLAGAIHARNPWMKNALVNTNEREKDSSATPGHLERSFDGDFPIIIRSEAWFSIRALVFFSYVHTHTQSRVIAEKMLLLQRARQNICFFPTPRRREYYIENIGGRSAKHVFDFTRRGGGGSRKNWKASSSERAAGFFFAASKIS